MARKLSHNHKCWHTMKALWHYHYCYEHFSAPLLLKLSSQLWTKFSNQRNNHCWHWLSYSLWSNFYLGNHFHTGNPLHFLQEWVFCQATYWYVAWPWINPDKCKFISCWCKAALSSADVAALWLACIWGLARPIERHWTLSLDTHWEPKNHGD